jgi:hypothetical protein
MAGDTTIAADPLFRRYLVLGPDLRVHRTVTFPPAAPGTATGQAAPDREEVFATHGTPTVADLWVTLIRVSLRTGEVTPVLRLRHAPFTLLEAGGQPIMVLLRYAPTDAFGVTAGGRIAVVRADGYRVDWFDREGARLATGPTTPFDLVPVAPEERRGPFGATLPEPQVKPPFRADHVRMDPAGHLWVRREERYGATRQRYDVFGPGSAYLVLTDDDGLQWLERHEFLTR